MFVVAPLAPVWLPSLNVLSNRRGRVMGRQIVDIVATFARGAAVLAAMGLLIVIASRMLEMMR